MSGFHNYDLWPGICPSRSNPRSKDLVPDIFPKLCLHMFQNGLKRYLAALRILHNQDFYPGIWRSRSNSRWKEWVPDIDKKLRQQMYQNRLNGSLHNHVKGHGCVSCSGMLAIVWYQFGIGADIIWGRYLVPRLLSWILPWRSTARSKFMVL